MTQQEFETRVKVQVNVKEFYAINEVYMNCDLDKDAFCKQWVRMNKKHIAQLKAAEAAQKAKQALNSKLRMLLEHLTNGYLATGYRWYPSYLSDDDAETLKAANICTFTNVYALCGNIENFINA